MTELWSGGMEAGPNVSTRILHGTIKTRSCCASLSLQSWHSYRGKTRIAQAKQQNR